ncbi:hypothetical protein [Arcticibacter tournemirensis]|uniref:Uncharacterized protein n=1 Tax=Arcticibacter tournemirensis TaxID=699437 RepID=A0A4Q0MG27_9SPHI|nr:hypothetical protein [Arcticibacter tournemirensis]RXF72285.1 hypothetical protein EKH83_00735 [Arcticibacter tournemirensis]
MASHPKPSGSGKYQTLVIATLDYLIDHYTGEFVYDGWDPVKQHYERQKVQAEKYGKKGQLAKLKKQLDEFIERLQINADSDFHDYIKKRTGFELNIFKDLEDFRDEVLLRGEIRDEIESRKLSRLLMYYERTGVDTEKQTALYKILTDFLEKAAAQQKQNSTTRIVRTEEKDGVIIETIEVSFVPRPKHNKRREVPSPDGERRLFISEWVDNKGTQANTSIDISFKTCSGGIYAVDGIHPEINALWKNNNTVVIETSKDYSILFQHRLIQSFEDVVNEEYMSI